MTRSAVLILVLSAVPGFAQMVSFDGTSYPEETSDGWVRLEVVYQGDRWIENGWFVQDVEIVAPGPPVVGQSDFYRRQLLDQAGATCWFLEWRAVTDGPEAFSAVAPASIVAGGQSGVIYHFTFARDRVRFLRGAQFPIVFADFEPGPHVFRLELRGFESYSFTIDAQEIDSGVPEAPYPTDDSAIVFGATAAIESSVTRWDYIEFGFLPTGDMDEDGDVDVADFEMFQSCIAEGGPQAPTDPACWGADVDQDGDVDFHDFAPFQRAFTGPE